MGLLFHPRGASAPVARTLASALPEAGWDVTVVTGSLPGGPGDARRFYAGLDVRDVDFTAALAAPDPLLADPPLPPSFEDRPGAPDRVMCSLSDEVFEHQVAAWAKELAGAGAARADVLHLHHLTPLNEAASLVAPDVPVVAHLHGTELTMLEAIDERGHHNGPAAWEWADRMRRWSARAECLIVPSEREAARAERLLDVEPERCHVLRVGVASGASAASVTDRRAFWRRRLVEAPRGWAPGHEPGTLRYREDDLAPFAGTILLFAGRFLEHTRCRLLIEAFARARPGFFGPAALVLADAFPGEWEAEHPLDTIQRTGARDVFLAGWLEHEELRQALAAADVLVAPGSHGASRLLALGMAAGVAPIASGAADDAAAVEHGQTGWLVEPGDVQSLANALVEAVNRPAERRRRGALAAALPLASPGLAARELAGIYQAIHGSSDRLTGAS
jgi:glycosyltransferase involved in cell wall biosynthesis